MKINVVRSLVAMASLLFAIPPANAGVGISSFGDGWKKANLSPASFYSRFKLRSEFYILDTTGKKLISPTTDLYEWEASRKSHKIDATFKAEANGFKSITMHVEWQLNDDKSIDALIQQYENAETDPKDMKKNIYGKLIREEHRVIENFAPVTWVADENAQTRVVLRLTPVMENIRESESIGKITIGGDRGSFVITDNQGYLWGDNVRLGGVISGIKCHRGAFVMSYYPFKGAKEIGSVSGKTIELSLTEDLTVKIRSETDLIPGEMRVKVYGKFLPSLKTTSVNSATSFGQETFEQLDKEFK